MPDDDGRDPLGDDPAAGDVVGHEERLGAAHDDVVDDHPDEVEADGVVPVERLGDGDLRADAVGGGGEHGPPVGGEPAGVEHPGEAAEPAEHLGPGRAAHRLLHQLDGTVAGLDVDPGRRVGDGGGLVGRARLAHARKPTDPRGHPESGAQVAAWATV